MDEIILFLRRVFGAVFIGLGILAGIAGFFGTGIYTSWWYGGGGLTTGDHHWWKLFAAMLAGGPCLVWVGLRLLPDSRAAGMENRSFRLTLTGSQRRRSANHAAGGTCLWLAFAAFICWQRPADDMADRVLQTALGMIAAYFGIGAVFLCHELGHLCMAALVGMKPQKIQVGTGPCLFRGRCGELQVEWRVLLGGGLILASRLEEHGWRWRFWVLIAGGPAAHAAVGLLLAAWMFYHPATGLSLHVSNDVTTAVQLFLLGYAAWAWLFAMFPRRARVGSVQAYTDGFWLLRAPQMSQDAVQANIIITGIRRIDNLWEMGRRDTAWSVARQLLARYPSNAALYGLEGELLRRQGDHTGEAASFQRWLGAEHLPELVRRLLSASRFAALARAGEPDAARQFCLDTLENTAAENRFDMLDGFATAVLSEELNGFLNDANAWSREALSLEPTKITLKGSRGAVLTELGCLDESGAMLREVWETSASEVDAAITAFYLGVIAKRRGHRREMRRWRGRAKSFAPFVGPWLDQRIKRDLNGVLD